MSSNKEYQLELNEESIKLIEDYAKKTNQTEEQVVDYILFEFLEKQAPIIEKRAQEVGRPANELMNMQFIRILEVLNSQADKKTK
ncbi:MAG: hypothetical protein K6U74_10685 [Firmicutes bacterium]|nr:hypothetical protein [Bacillota bacterium]